MLNRPYKEFTWKTSFAESIFNNKYKHDGAETWPRLCRMLVNDVCGDRSLCAKPNESPLMSETDMQQLEEYMIDMKFIPGGRYLYYCFDPQEQVLKADYTWDRALNIKEGDELIGFDEVIKDSRFKNTKVTFTAITTKPKYKIYTTLGTVVVSGDHQFVAKEKLISKKPKDAYKWIKATELDLGNVIAFSSQPWEVDTSYDAGWLAGFMDGEGTVSKGSISISQKPGLALDNAIRILTEKKINFYITGRTTDTVKTIYIRGRWESAKVLGMFRPQRLLANWYKNELGCFWSRINPPAIVTKVEFLGVGDVCVIETDTHTLIGNGFLSHNCGRPASYFNNCFCLRAEEDTREEWGNIVKRASDCLMSGGGIGVDYSVLRPSGRALSRTGGISSGPLPLMSSVNEIGRNVMQGGSRRSAIYASLNWQHEDIIDFLYAKDWPDHIKELKANDFNFPANFDMTNMSINWDTKFASDCLPYSELNKKLPYTGIVPDLWYKSVLQMCKTGEPGHSYNFWENENETLRNACTEFTSEDDSDVCNLGSINLANISSLEELKSVVNLASKFLVCGSIRGDLPYEKVKLVREKNRKIGLGLMGVHEWLLQRGYTYEMVEELKLWLEVYASEGERGANEWSDRFFINRPKKYRAIAPAGTLSILASTSSGVEPLFAVAYKRRYLQSGTKWKYQYVIDSTAQRIIEKYGINPESIETAYTLSSNPERRIKFQYEVQKYVDMAISSTINLPEWSSDFNNESTARTLAEILLHYCHGLRGITVYPNGSRGGQPLTEVPYEEAIKHKGIEYAEENTCSGGICSI